MGTPNRFQDFFEEGKYVTFKNSLYNYRLRKHAIEKELSSEKIHLALEVGSGLSPVMTKTSRIVYSDLSLIALQTLKKIQPRGFFVVADGTKLPFKEGSFSHAISSEVLEHIEDDEGAIREFSRVLKPSGELLLTFPHRKCYFSIDDRFVEHLRRYELYEMESKLEAASFKSITTQKVLGPFDKLAMCIAVIGFRIVSRKKRSEEATQKTREPSRQNPLLTLLKPLFWAINTFLMAWAWLDARIFPQSLSTILLIKALKKG